MKRAALMILVLFMVLPTAAGRAFASAEGPIRIGGIMPVTGHLASDGQRILNAVQLAVMHVNENGGLLGRNVEFTYEDAGSNPDLAINATNRVIAADYDVILGPHFSFQILAVAGMLNDAEKLNLVGGTHYTILQNVTNPYTVRARVPDGIQTKAIVPFMNEVLGAKKVGLLMVNDDWGQGATKEATEYFASVGVEYVVETFNNEDRDFTTQLLSFRRAGVDSLLLWSYGDAAVIIARQIYELGINLPVMINGAVTQPEITARMDPEWYNGWYSTSQWNPYSPEPASVEFRSAYEKAYGESPEFIGAAWYAGTKWLMECIEKAGSTDKDAVLAVMKQTKDYQALNGIYTWNDRNLNDSIYIVQVLDGTLVDVMIVEDR